MIMVSGESGDHWQFLIISWIRPRVRNWSITIWSFLISLNQLWYIPLPSTPTTSLTSSHKIPAYDSDSQLVSICYPLKPKHIIPFYSLRTQTHCQKFNEKTSTSTHKITDMKKKHVLGNSCNRLYEFSRYSI